MSKIIRLLLLSFIASVVACADSSLEPSAHQAAEQTNQQMSEPSLLGYQDPMTSSLPNQYTVRVPVTSRSDDARDLAFQTGLRQVYMQLTGHANIDDYPSLKSSVQNANAWVAQYQYQQSGDMTFMMVQYNQHEVDNALKNANMSAYVEPVPGASATMAGPKAVTIVMTDVNNLDAYLRVDAFLNTMQGVSNVQTTALKIPSVTFQMTVTDPLDHFQHVLGQAGFISHADRDDDMTPAITLYYRYSTPRSHDSSGDNGDNDNNDSNDDL